MSHPNFNYESKIFVNATTKRLVSSLFDELVCADTHSATLSLFQMTSSKISAVGGDYLEYIATPRSPPF